MTSLQASGVGDSRVSASGLINRPSPLPRTPSEGCIDCGGLGRDHVSAGHVFRTQGECISCERWGDLREHDTGHLVCPRCYIERNGVLG